MDEPKNQIDKIFKQEIRITEKAKKEGREHWSDNVNHKSVFWLSDP